VVRRFCARCGRPETPDNPLIGGLCLQCYLEERGVAQLPREIEVTVCPRCGSIRMHGAWLPPEPGGLEEVVEEEILAEAKPNPEVAQIWVEEVSIVMHGGSKGLAKVRLGARFHVGVEAGYETVIPLRIRHVLCPHCLRQAGKSYEATLQLRGEAGRLDPEKMREVEGFLHRLPRHLSESIGEVEEKREGLDLRVLDQSSARSIASKLRSRFAARVLETHKVVGRRRDGKARVRTTILVRLPSLRRGDIVIYEGRPAVVSEISGNRIYLETAAGRRVSLSGDEFWRAGGLERVDERNVKTLMVTAVTPGTLMLLDLDEYRILEAPLENARLAGTLKPGDRVQAVIHEGRIYILGKA
jgi:nonsense-mediated mRNA decay protein 3